MTKEKIVFIDRDGVINKCPGVGEYVLNESQLHVYDFAPAAFKKLKENGFKIYIISNQACVAKQLCTEQDAIDTMKKMLRVIEGEGEKLVDGVYFCKHHSGDSCFHRKPNPGMIFEVFKKLEIDKDELDYVPYFIGDTIRDIETAYNAGVRGLLVFTGRENPQNNSSWSHKPHAVATDLAEAVDIIVDELKEEDAV